MDADDPLKPKQRSAAAETLEAVSARLRPVARIDGNLYRVVEVVRAPNGRLSKIGQIWHSDLEQVRRFGHALAGNTVADHVQVADAAGTVIETIPAPPPGSAPAGWGQWRATPLPPAPPRPPPRVRAQPPKPPAHKPPPTMVPPIIPRALPPTLAPAAPPATRPPVDLPVMAPENEVERTSPLPPTIA